MVKGKIKRSWESEDRRIGKDLKRHIREIFVYRWFFVFIKCALELENKTFEIRGKSHRVKFNRNHQWWKLINLKSIPKTPKFIRYDYKLMPSQIDKLFNRGFYPKYRDLFNERSTIFGKALQKTNDYQTIHIPPNYPVRSILSDIRSFYKGKTEKIIRRKGQTARSNAEIVLENTTEGLMKRLFHTLRIEQSEPNLTNLEIYFQVSKSLNKQFKIPEIERLNASGAIGSRQRTTRQDFEPQIRSTQRDRRFAKILILNLCNGKFPKIDSVK